MSSSASGADTSFWEARRNRITSSVGGWFGGKDVYCHGYSMMNELLGHISYMQMVVLNATGRLVEERVARWLEGNFIGLSYPDPRIWCNQIGALAGATRCSVVAATAAGALAADSRAYGGSLTSQQGIEFIRRALAAAKGGATVAAIVEGVAKDRRNLPAITGYARPVDRADERIAPYERMTRSLGFAVGEHLTLAYAISDYLEAHYGLGMNAGGYIAAFLADQGFSGEEVYRIKALAVASGVTACYADTRAKPAGAFLPLRCDDIDYQGPPARELP